MDEITCIDNSILKASAVTDKASLENWCYNQSMESHVMKLEDLTEVTQLTLTLIKQAT